MSQPWYETLFDEKYLKTYVDVFSDADTEHQVDFITQFIPVGGTVLDMPCGYGRVSNILARQGYQVTGVDLSEYLLDMARSEAENQGLDVEYVHSDMREFKALNTFDATLSVFSSFGYFDDIENEHVLHNYHASLKAGGTFILDVNNVLRLTYLMQHEGNKNSETGLYSFTRVDNLSNGLEVAITVSFDPLTSRSVTTSVWQENGEEKSYTFDMRLYTATELNVLLKAVGFSEIRWFGNFKGDAYSTASSRVIAVCIK